MKAQMRYADRSASAGGGDRRRRRKAAGAVTIKDPTSGAMAGGVADNKTWREDRPGQVTVPRGELIAAVRRILSELR